MENERVQKEEKGKKFMFGKSSSNNKLRNTKMTRKAELIIRENNNSMRHVNVSMKVCKSMYKHHVMLSLLNLRE